MEDILTQCPHCSAWYPVDGPPNYFRHVVEWHPDSDEAVAITNALLRRAERLAERLGPGTDADPAFST